MVDKSQPVGQNEVQRPIAPPDKEKPSQKPSVPQGKPVKPSTGSTDATTKAIGGRAKVQGKPLLGSHEATDAEIAAFFLEGDDDSKTPGVKDTAEITAHLTETQPGVTVNQTPPLKSTGQKTVITRTTDDTSAAAANTLDKYFHRKRVAQPLSEEKKPWWKFW
jgi:hypothetical protein